MKSFLIFFALALSAFGADWHVNRLGNGGSIGRGIFDGAAIVHGSGWKHCASVSRNDVQAAGKVPSSTCCHFLGDVEDGPAFAGEMRAVVTNGELSVGIRMLATRPGRLETISFQGGVNKQRFRGGKVIADGKECPIADANGNWTKDVELRQVSKLRLVMGVDACGGTSQSTQEKFLEFDFARPMMVSLMARGKSETVTVRISALRHSDVKFGDLSTISFTVRMDEPIEDPVKPWTASAGERFVPLAYDTDIIPGSALDFSSIVKREPCGKYGRLRVKGGHFEFERLPGVRQKFYGINLHSYACYHAPAEAARLVDFFVRCGYNAIRLHKFENEWMGLTKDSPDEATPVAARFEGIDNLMAACRARGVYMTVDMHVGRCVSYRALGMDKDGKSINRAGMKGEMKYLYLTEPAARENFKRLIRGFFEHVNPHTGNAYAHEPTLALVSVVNESPGCWSRFSKEGRNADMCKEEYELMREMSEFIRRDLKSEVPLTTCNGCGMPFCLQPMREDFCDYVDDHFYYDHPRWPDNAVWTTGDRVPLFTANRRQFAAFGELPAQALMTRLWGKPFVITEFNWCAPSLYRGTAGLLVGAFAGAQDWDGLWRYLWAHDHKRAFESGKHPIAKLESASDPLALAAERAAMCLFLRGDMSSLQRKAAVTMSPKFDCHKPHRRVWSSAPQWYRSGWFAQIGTAMRNVPADSKHNFRYPEDVDMKRDEVDRIFAGCQPADGAVWIDRERNAFAVTTPRTCGGSVESGSFAAGPLAVDCGKDITALWASSLDGRDLESSTRILLTHLTRLYNTGDRFADRDGDTLLATGKPPYLMPRAKAVVRLRCANPLKVYAIETNGRRRGEIPANYSNGVISFTCETDRDPNQATFIYELSRSE